MNTRAGSLKKEKKIDKTLTRLVKKEWERTQINNIRNERREITDTREIQRNVRKYYEHLYINKLDDLDEMDKFLETYNLPKLNQEEQRIWIDRLQLLKLKQ